MFFWNSYLESKWLRGDNWSWGSGVGDWWGMDTTWGGNGGKASAAKSKLCVPLGCWGKRQVVTSGPTPTTSSSFFLRLYLLK